MNESVILIMSDLSAPREAFRAYYAGSLDSDSVCPVVGYCSSTGSFRTIREAAQDARRRDKVTPIYRDDRRGTQRKLPY